MFSKQKFDEYRDKYKRFLSSAANYDESYKWTALGAYEEHWNIAAVDFATMYDAAIQQGEGERLWSDKNDSAKSVMIEFAKMNPIIVRDMFEDLYKSSSDIVLRMDRFVHHCDQMVNELQSVRPSANVHYHDNYRMISFYLAMKHPDEYVIYNFLEFKSLMTMLGAKTNPGLKEIDRFFKVMKTLYKFLIQDEELVAAYKAKLESQGTSPDLNLFLAHDFCSCCTNGSYMLDRY